jgi:membrane peptidoglycan carboxypeptidase
MQRVEYELETMYGYTRSQIANDGLRIYTTVSKKLMNSLYASVQYNENLMKHCTPPGYVSAAPAPCTGLPKYVHVGALLENPQNGAILAMYGGKNFNRTKWDDALESRNQVGSSFKPYVLSTAVQQGMNVETSVLDGDSPLWIPYASEPYTYASPKAPPPGQNWFEVSNDESGNNNLGPVSVETATAASLNTAYADLWHRVALSHGQYNVVNMAKSFGVDTQASGLWNMRDQAGTALGQASLTVQEQATMIATLADHGLWHTPHMVAKIVRATPWGTTLVTNAKIQHHVVLTKPQAADVDWAMSFDTSPGGTAAGLGLTNGQTVIAKTGTTNLSQSAFFLGATQRDAMAVGMFVSKPKCPARLYQLCHSTSALAFAPPKGIQTLFGVGGFSGYGGQWPALIWHTYFMKNFNTLPPLAWPAPNNDGTRWNLVGFLPKPKPKPKRPENHGPRCHRHGRFEDCHSPLPTVSPNPTPSGLPTPTPTSRCQPPVPCKSGSPTPTHHGHGPGGATSAAMVGAPLAMLLIVAAGPAMPLARRRLRRRARTR